MLQFVTDRKFEEKFS